MTPVTRRTALRMAAGTTALGLAGCLGQDGGDGDGNGDGDAAAGDLRLGELAVTNFDADAHTIHIVFLDGDSPVYWRSNAVAAAEDGAPGEVVFDDYPNDPGNGVLHARLDDQSEDEWERFDFAEVDASCLGLQIRIGDFGENRGSDLSIWTSNSPRKCDDGAAAAE